MTIYNFSCRTKPLLGFLLMGILVAMFAMSGCKNGDKTKGKANEGKAAEAKTLEKLPMEATGPVAIVDGVEISKDRFNETAQRRMGNMSSPIPPQLMAFFQEKLLDMVIDEYLLDQKIDNSNIKIDQEELDKGFNDFKGRFPTTEDYNKFLKENNLEESRIREDMRKDLILQKIMIKESNIDLSDEVLKAEYDEYLEEFKQEEQVRASHILIPVSGDADQDAIDQATKKAKEVAAKAQAPDADFAALAKAESSCPSSASGGDLNFFAAEMMVTEFSEAAFAMKVGEISDPVRSQFGYHIIKVTDRKEARTIPFDEAKVIIKEKLKEEKMQAAFESLMNNLKSGVTIEKLEENIRVNEMPAPPVATEPVLQKVLEVKEEAAQEEKTEAAD